MKPVKFRVGWLPFIISIAFSEEFRPFGLTHEYPASRFSTHHFEASLSSGYDTLKQHCTSNRMQKKLEPRRFENVSKKHGKIDEKNLEKECRLREYEKASRDPVSFHYYC